MLHTDIDTDRTINYMPWLLVSFFGLLIGAVLIIISALALYNNSYDEPEALLVFAKFSLGIEVFFLIFFVVMLSIQEIYKDE